MAAGLTAFVRDGAILPRTSGDTDTPMAGAGVVAFKSPDGMRREFVLPNTGKVSGMAISRGVTLIVGGGFRKFTSSRPCPWELWVSSDRCVRYTDGKSTLLQALELGVYDHIPGDGREFVVIDPAAVKIRAEDGRAIESVDISPFIDNLPYGKSTTSFSTPDASGSTS